MTAVDSAMVLAAGLGLRLRPLTDTLPKPLVALNGRTLLDRALDHLEAAGVARVVVNAHYQAAQIAAHVARRAKPVIALSLEPELLDTGGGIAKALPQLGEPFFAVNSDAVWIDGTEPLLHRLARAWDVRRFDAVMAVHSAAKAVGYEGRGDFFLDAAGAPRRRGAAEVAPFVFAGVQLLSRRLFAGEPVAKYSLNRLWDKAIAQGRVVCLVHDGRWYDVGTRDGFAAAAAELAELRA